MKTTLEKLYNYNGEILPLYQEARKYKNADEFVKAQEGDIVAKNYDYQDAVNNYNAARDKINQETSFLINTGGKNPAKIKDLQTRLSILEYPKPEDFGIKTVSQLTDIWEEAQKADTITVKK